MATVTTVTQTKLANRKAEWEQIINLFEDFLLQGSKGREDRINFVQGGAI